MTEPHYTGVSEYVLFLAESKLFRLLWIGEIINQFGGWFTLVAAISVVETLTKQQSIAVSILLILRSLPKLVMFPLAGAAADSLNRASVVMGSALAQCGIVLLFPFAILWNSLWLMYLLVFLQHSVGAFYDPARSALTPLIVPPHHLHLASALDTFAWSVMAAVGSSLGGFAMSGIGPVGCFLVDACSFLLAAMTAAALVPAAAAFDSSPTAGYSPVMTNSDLASKDQDQAEDSAETGDPTDKLLTGTQLLDMSRQHTGHSHTPAKLSGSTRHAVRKDSSKGPRAAWTPGDTACAQLASCRCCIPLAAATGGTSTALAAILQRGYGAFATAVSYIGRAGNADVAVLVTLKLCGGLAWGAMDVMAPRYASMSSMQIMHDEPATLGLIYAASGVGCGLGPLVTGLVPNNARTWLQAVAASFGVVFVSYLLMMVAPGLWLVLLASVLRAICSFVIWVYSYPLLQHRVDTAVQGSVFALEQALYTTAECSVAVLSGVALDAGRLPLPTVLLAVAALNIVLAVLWACFSSSRMAAPTIAMCDAALVAPSLGISP